MDEKKVEQQVRTLCQQEFFRGSLLRELLKLLVYRALKDDNFESLKALTTGFDERPLVIEHLKKAQQIKNKKGSSQPPDRVAAVKALVGKLGNALQRYYDAPSLRDEIEIKRSKRGARVEITERQLPERPEYGANDRTKSEMRIPAQRVPTREGRGGALIGHWRGRGKDTLVVKDPEIPSFSFDVNAEFWDEGSEISGRLTIKVIEPPRNSSVVLELRGYFYDDYLIQTFYQSTDPNYKQAGAALLNLSRNGTEVNAVYAAFSTIRNCLITGEIQLTKLSTASPAEVSLVTPDL